MIQDHISYFKTILDEKGVIEDPNDFGSYEVGARHDQGNAAFILRPRTSEQVSLIMAYAYKEKLHIVAQSGNTGLVGGSVPDESGAQIVLSLERMNNIYDIDPLNQSAYAGAGVRLSSLNTQAQKSGLELPIDLGSDPCLGGMVSTNTGGSRFLKYRGMREHVLGIKAVMADEKGSIIDVLWPLHKNNVGLDIKQLFIGSGGILGIVTEVTVRLAPILRQSAAALLIPSDVSQINLLLTQIEQRCGTYLSAFEGMSGNAMKAAFAHQPSLPSPFGLDAIPDYAILLEIGRTWDKRESEESLDEVMEHLLSELWDLQGAPLENALLGSADKLWQLRHSISEGVQKSGKLFGFDISFKRGDVVRFRNTLEERLRGAYPELLLCDFGHIGDGAIHSALVLDRNDARCHDPQYEATLRKWVNDIVVHEFHGSYSAEHGLGRKNINAYHDYTPESVKQLTRLIKDCIAPASVGAIQI